MVACAVCGCPNAGVPRRRCMGVQHLVQHGAEAGGDDLVALRDAKPRLALCRHLDACHGGRALKLQHKPRLSALRCSPRSSAPTAHIAPQPEFLCSDRTRRPRRRPLRPSPRRRPPRTPPPPRLRLLLVARSAATLLGAPSPFPWDPRSITWLRGAPSPFPWDPRSITWLL
ncbi:hypothetical protein ACQJBY_068611 [Aegilops geniculata]